MDLHLINTVRRIRVKKKISQVELAQKMGLSDGVIGKIENVKQRAKYNIRHINLLARALACSPRDLLPEKTLSMDMVKIKARIIKQTRANKGEPNFEIISIAPLKD